MRYTKTNNKQYLGDKTKIIDLLLFFRQNIEQQTENATKVDISG